MLSPSYDRHANLLHIVMNRG